MEIIKEAAMNVIYPCIFTVTHDNKDTYLIYIPDIDGQTEGFGLNNAFFMARDYMGLTFYNKADETLPKPGSLLTVTPAKSPFFDPKHPDDTFVTLVDLDLDAYRRMMNKKSVRRNVSIPAWLNQAADDAHINVSRVLQDALMEKLNLR